MPKLARSYIGGALARTARQAMWFLFPIEPDFHLLSERRRASQKIQFVFSCQSRNLSTGAFGIAFLCPVGSTARPGRLRAGKFSMFFAAPHAAVQWLASIAGKLRCSPSSSRPTQPAVADGFLVRGKPLRVPLLPVSRCGNWVKRVKSKAEKFNKSSNTMSNFSLSNSTEFLAIGNSRRQLSLDSSPTQRLRTRQALRRPPRVCCQLPAPYTRDSAATSRDIESGFAAACRKFILRLLLLLFHPQNPTRACPAGFLPFTTCFERPRTHGGDPQPMNIKDIYLDSLKSLATPRQRPAFFILSPRTPATSPHNSTWISPA